MKIILIVVLCTLLSTSYGFRIRQGGNQPTAEATTEIDNSLEGGEIITDEMVEEYANCLHACTDIQLEECSENCLSQVTQSINQLSRLQTSTNQVSTSSIESMQQSLQQRLADMRAQASGITNNIPRVISIPNPSIGASQSIQAIDASLSDRLSGITQASRALPNLSSAFADVERSGNEIAESLARMNAEINDPVRINAEIARRNQHLEEVAAVRRSINPRFYGVGFQV
jgi:hypothetical protein